MSPVDEDLQELKDGFEPYRLERQAQYQALEKLRLQFIELFPRSRIRELSLDDYVQGKGGKTNFCYWVERKTNSLGSIKGSYSIAFGVYYEKEKNAYRFQKMFKSETDALSRILAEIDHLLAAAEADDIERIRQSTLSPMFTGKILFLYFPTKFLNIFSERHVDHYLSRLRAGEPGKKLDLVSKRERLLQIKNTDDKMKDWTMFEFSNFLYTALRPPPSLGSKLAVKLGDSGLDYPSVDKTEPEFVELQIGEFHNSTSTPALKRGGVADFEKRNQRNKLAGNQGEDIVLRVEREHLERNGRQDLVDAVIPICRRNDGAGYDILSFELDGREKQIEVKSTIAKAPSANGVFQFHLSANELEQARSNSNYHLYVVFEVKSLRPKIWRVPNPASLEPKRLKLTPATYHATVTVS